MQVGSVLGLLGGFGYHYFKNKETLWPRVVKTTTYGTGIGYLISTLLLLGKLYSEGFEETAIKDRSYRITYNTEQNRGDLLFLLGSLSGVFLKRFFGTFLGGASVGAAVGTIAWVNF